MRMRAHAGVVALSYMLLMHSPFSLTWENASVLSYPPITNDGAWHVLRVPVVYVLTGAMIGPSVGCLHP